MVPEDMPEGVGPNAGMPFGDASALQRAGFPVGAPTAAQRSNGRAPTPAPAPPGAGQPGPGTAPAAPSSPPGPPPMTRQRVDSSVFSDAPRQHQPWIVGLRTLAASGHYPTLHALAQMAERKASR